MERILERCEINTNDCWDLTKIIKNQDEYKKLIDLAKEKNKEIVSMKGHILDSEETLYDFLKKSEEESRALERLLIYTKFSFDEDTRDSERKKSSLEIEALINDIQEKESFITSEFMEKNFEDAEKMVEKKKELEVYKRYFKELYKEKDRILSEKEEKIITIAQNTFGTPEDAFTSLDTSDASFEMIEIDGKKVELNHYNYREFLENPNQEIRKEAFLKYHAFYKNHKNTFASLLKGNYQELEFQRIIRKYSSALEMALDSINVSKKVYENLIDEVHKHMKVNINYQKLKAKLLGTEEYHLYDIYVPVSKMPKKKYTKEEAIKLVSKALEPLGEDYLKKFHEVIDGKTVDFYPNVGKHSGAYQWGCYDSPSYVLLNFIGTFDSVSTLAHELGHAVHSEYSKENNPYIYEGYEIFLAEIASTVNEMLLSTYMLRNAKEKEEKIYYYCEFLDKVKGTIFRQTMFSEFERIMSEKCQNKESLTEEAFSGTYYKLNEEYFKDSVIVDEDIRYEGYRIPHLYSPFYVYQYATGLISAISIVSDILDGKKNITEKYIQFLSSGSSKDVLDILKLVDVDLTKEEPFEKAFDLIERNFEELKKIVEEGD